MKQIQSEVLGITLKDSFRIKQKLIRELNDKLQNINFSTQTTEFFQLLSNYHQAINEIELKQINIMQFFSQNKQALILSLTNEDYTNQNILKVYYKFWPLVGFLGSQAHTEIVSLI